MCRWLHLGGLDLETPTLVTVAESKKLEPEDVVTDLGWTSGPRWNTEDWEY